MGLRCHDQNYIQVWYPVYFVWQSRKNLQQDSLQVPALAYDSLVWRKPEQLSYELNMKLVSGNNKKKKKTLVSL